MPEFTSLREPVRPNFIGILGEDGAGKSTAGDLIQELLRGEGYSTSRAAFAGGLKEMVLELDPMLGARQIGKGVEAVRLSDLIDDGYTEQEVKDTYPEYRRVLRALGTDCLRSRDKDYWTRLFRLKHIEGNWWRNYVIVDDIRFENEARTISRGEGAQQGVVIKLVGRGTGRGAGEQIDQARHDVIIDNSSSIEDTRESLKEVLRVWGFNL